MIIVIAMDHIIYIQYILFQIGSAKMWLKIELTLSPLN